MRVWRLCRQAHAAFDGEGARAWGGRWNFPSTAVVYASSSQALAILELMAHLDSPVVPKDFVFIAADLPDSISMETIRPAELPRAWRDFPAPRDLAAMGSAWIQSKRTAILSVPSVLAPEDRNLLLNPSHPEFSRIQIRPPEPFRMDLRLAAKKKIN